MNHSLKISVKRVVGEKVVSVKLTNKNFAKYLGTLPEIKQLNELCNIYTNRKTLLAAVVDKAAKKSKDIPESLLTATIAESVAFKDNIIYFQDLKEATDKLIHKLEALPVLKSRVVYKGKGSNYLTLEERVCA